MAGFLRRYPLSPAHAVVVILSLMLAMALVLGLLGGNISEEMLRREPPHPSDPITVP
jgi:hypothetical protein